MPPSARRADCRRVVMPRVDGRHIAVGVEGCAVVDAPRVVTLQVHEAAAARRRDIGVGYR